MGKGINSKTQLITSLLRLNLNPLMMDSSSTLDSVDWFSSSSVLQETHITEKQDIVMARQMNGPY